MDRRSLLPLNLVGLLLLFVAPWVEIRCNGPLNQQMSFLRQSGLQAAIGQYDSQPALSLMGQIDTQGQLEMPLAGIREQVDQIQTRYRPSAAPLLLGYPLALLLALFASWRLSGNKRLAMISAGLGIAAAILAAQSVTGLPLASEPPALDLPDNREPQMNAVEAVRTPPPRLTTRWMPPFYLSWMLLVMTAILTLQEYRTPAADDAGRYG